MKPLGDKILVSLIILLIMGPFGCASAKNMAQNLINKESEYKRIMQQQQRQKALIDEQEEALKRLPEMTADSHEKLGDYYLQKGDKGRAFINYSKSLELEPKHTSARYKKGMLLLEKGVTDEAKKEFETIIENRPEYALAYQGMARVSLKLGDAEKAEDHFRMALYKDFRLWQAHNFLGIIFDRQKRHADAQTEYKSAIAIRPDIGMLFNNLGLSYYLSGEYEKAVLAFEEALRKSGDKKIFNNYGLALMKLGKNNEAFEAFMKADSEAAAYNNIGYMYMIEGKKEEAKKSFKKAIEINPQFYVRAYENLQKANSAIEPFIH